MKHGEPGCRIVAFLEAWPHWYGPTVREIADGAGISSVSVVSYNLVRLAAAGMIDYVPGRASAVRIRQHEGYGGDMQ